MLGSDNRWSAGCANSWRFARFWSLLPGVRTWLPAQYLPRACEGWEYRSGHRKCYQSRRLQLEYGGKFLVHTYNVYGVMECFYAILTLKKGLWTVGKFRYKMYLIFCYIFAQILVIDACIPTCTCATTLLSWSTHRWLVFRRPYHSIWKLCWWWQRNRLWHSPSQKYCPGAYWVSSKSDIGYGCNLYLTLIYRNDISTLSLSRYLVKRRCRLGRESWNNWMPNDSL